MFDGNFAMIVSLKVKKYILSVLALFVISVPVFAADVVTAKLNEIEKSYYGYTFSGNNDSRLTRLEKAIYGMNTNKPQQTRVDKIYKDLNLDVNLNGASMGSSTGGAASANNMSSSQAMARAKDIGPKAEAGIKYPVVDKMEQKTFKKAFMNDDIYVRLSRLEKQVFKKESTLSLNERVDALRSKILGGTQNSNMAAGDINDIDPTTEEIILENGKKYYGDSGNLGYGGTTTDFNNDDDSHYNYYSYENSKNRIPEVQSQYSDGSDEYSKSSKGSSMADDYEQKYNDYAQNYAQNYDLDILEKNLLGKKYQSESSSKRLARLESKVFSRTFSDSEEARTQRLLAVTTAQKTSQEYDSNKWARRLNTGIQIGSILLMVLAMIL